MLTFALALALSVPATSEEMTTSSSNPIHQLRNSEIAERLAQTEAKRVQLELQIAQAKHAINNLQRTEKPPSAVAQELTRYELLGIVKTAERSDILLRLGQQVIQLQDDVAGPMQLTASIEANWVRLKRFGQFRDLPIVQGW